MRTSTLDADKGVPVSDCTAHFGGRPRRGHLSGSASCRKLYSDDIFSILTRGRSKLHLAVLEALYIRKLDPELCVQKENVLSLQLFGVTPRESVTSVP